MNDPFRTGDTTHPDLVNDRDSLFQYTLFDSAGNRLDSLPRVSGGLISRSEDAEIRATGQIDLALREDEAKGDFEDCWVQIEYVLNPGSEDPIVWPVERMLIATPSVDYDEFGRRLSADLYDALIIPKQWEIGSWKNYPQSANPVQIATTALSDMGVTSWFPAQPDVRAASSQTAFAPNDSWLKVINTFLRGADLLSLRPDPYGRLGSDFYRAPDERPTVWVFRDGEFAIHLPEMREEQDFFNTPNEFTVYERDSGMDGFVPRRVAGRNTDPDSPVSVATRGRVVSSTEEVEASGSTVAERDKALKAKLDALMAANRKVYRKVVIRHEFLPLRLGDVIELDSSDLRGRFAISAMEIPLDPLELTTTTLREV